MRIGLIPKNPIEWILDKFGLIPRALLDTFPGAARARSIMIAARLGVFESLTAGPRSLDQIAASTATNAAALERLLNVLVACDYLTLRHGKWGLCPHVRRWMLRSSRHGIADQVLHGFAQWEAIESFEKFIRTGKPVELHEQLAPEDWPPYVRGMKSLAALAVTEVVARINLPRHPKRMLDIGGCHGRYSSEFCRQYPGLKAVILDLPEAIEHAAPLLAQEDVASRIAYRPGNALSDSLGEGEWDFIFVSQLLHHFTGQTNELLCRRMAQALKPGGVLAIAEIERTANPKSKPMGAILDLYFAATSRSGTWSAAEIRSWQAKAGLSIGRMSRLWALPGIVILPAKRLHD